ncbi:hypothetical protein AC578_851 [Pseudocercospora eumusae]|uniref:CFEM domain-containing protein n=1 Tax=Pseudocercospora eumusae TaxID=321146 RepID=A0A139H4B0_9PEZI|nr:hypothetical protein AC578_851 [Pseudocercospora eumusae]
MHAIYPSIFALAAFAVAQDLSDTTEAIKLIPTCAIGCFTEGIANSTCGPTDAHCQCTTGATDIAKVVVPCLCKTMADGSCSVDELMKADEATMKICTAALQAKGETFKAPPPADPSMCKATSGGVSGSTPSSAGGYGGGNMTGGSTTTGGNNMTNTSTSSGHSASKTSPAASKGAAPAVSAVESFKLLISCGMLGLAGVALMVL